MPNRINPEGPRTSHIALFGESPWKTEDALGRPFVGASGNLMKRWWGEIGLARDEVYIDNMYPYMPPFPAPPGDRLKSVPLADLILCMRSIHQRIAHLPDVRVIVPTGNYATFALLGKGKVPARVYQALGQNISQTTAEKKAGITQLRGSIYEYTDLNGRKLKVIPTIHAAGVLQHVGWEARTVLDWKRIKREAETAELDAPQRYVNSEPSETTLTKLIANLSRNPTWPIALDIETWGHTLTCCGFATSRDYAVVLKTPNKSDRKYWLPWIKALCALPNPKVMQNGLFDSYWLKQFDVDIMNWQWDTMCIHHALNPTETHSLEFLTSIYTKQTYYKDEAKDAEEIRKYLTKMDSLWNYNGLDCCVTWEIQRKLLEELKERDLLHFYQKHYRDMFQPLLDTMLHGVRVDVPAQKVFAKRLFGECEALREELKEAAGEELYATERKCFWRKPSKQEWQELIDYKKIGIGKEIINVQLKPPAAKYINPEARKRLGYIMTRGEIRGYKEKLKKDFSGLKLRKFFHEKLGAPEQHKRGKDKKVTLDAVALKKLADKYPRKVRDYPIKVIMHREKKKEHQYVKGAWDSDGRIRCSYKLTTDAGRLASSKNPQRRGYNLQNVKRGELRKTYLPDKGCIFVRVDMSQDEDRRMKMYTQQPRMIELANLRPDEYDTHTEQAAAIFGVPREKVTKEQRELGKRAVHAACRGMHGNKLSDILLKAGHYVSPKECQRLIDAYFKANPEVQERYFPYVRDTFIRDGCLTNTWGRSIRFDNELSMGRLDDAIWRKLFTFLLQSECADNLNQNGFIPAWKWLKHHLQKPPNLQVHDEVIASLPLDHAYAYTAFIVEWLEQPRWYFGNKLVVPAGITVGMNWLEGHEWKKLPERKEFDEVAWEVCNDAKH